MKINKQDLEASIRKIYSSEGFPLEQASSVLSEPPTVYRGKLSNGLEISIIEKLGKRGRDFEVSSYPVPMPAELLERINKIVSSLTPPLDLDSSYLDFPPDFNDKISSFLNQLVFQAS